ncbi:MAG TPA: pitrilysin family protein [Gemmatimonadota bacterium]|nr:pitrilysin family protein [Gemmatimonadota bacterium]
MQRVLTIFLALFGLSTAVREAAAQAEAQGIAPAEMAPIRVPYTWHVLPNGLTVLLHEDPTTPTVGVNVWYHVGSGNEDPGRTGFAHLFEHIMFEGSGHVPEGMFDQWLEAAGGDTNGSTNTDRTNYWVNVPSNALELALFLESDRMGYLLEAMSPAKVDGQRDVVKNERRQSYENRPYGMAFLTLGENLYPPEHPYHWPTIGSMEDLSAASYEDVVGFFGRYYGPSNASLAIAGDIDSEETIGLVEKWFGEIPAGEPVPPIDPPAAVVSAEKRLTLEDRVQLPRMYMCWLTPAHFAPGDAALDVVANVLAGGKNSRLYKRLVYDLQIAQDVSAGQFSSALSSEFCVITTARSGHTLEELERVVQEELDRLEAEPPTEREVERAVHQYEASFLDRLERVGGFGGKADQLNAYFFATGNPDYFQEDLARYRALDPSDIQAALRSHLQDDARVILNVVPATTEDEAPEELTGAVGPATTGSEAR